MDSCNFSYGIVIDLKKAFDTVDHDILLQKLSHYRIRGVANKLTCSYLKDRAQFTSVENALSSLGIVKCGVLQGSILGPLLFILYINHLNLSISKSNCYHFADNTSLVCSNNSFKKLVKDLNHDLSNVSDWLKANKLSLNIKNTEVLLFYP